MLGEPDVDVITVCRKCTLAMQHMPAPEFNQQCVQRALQKGPVTVGTIRDDMNGVKCAVCEQIDDSPRFNVYQHV